VKYWKSISLKGKWKFKLDPEGMGDCHRDGDISMGSTQATAFFLEDVEFYSPTYDDSEWEEIRVPAAWQEEGYRYNGIAWYRRTFNYQSEAGLDIVRLLFKGVDYYADVWLNGYYLGSHEGYFNHFFFDVSKYIRPGENLLVVRVDSPNDINPRVRPYEKKLIKGALQDWDVNDLSTNQGGIFDDVELLRSRKLYIERVKIDVLINYVKNTAEVYVKGKIYNSQQERITANLQATVNPANFSGKAISCRQLVDLLPGANEVSIKLEVEEPHLWWTWDLGKPNLYHLNLSLNQNGIELDQIQERFGIREIKKLKGWESYLNNKRVFYRGTNYLSDILQSRIDRPGYERDVDLMIKANMNMVRLFCVVEKEEFYEVCDEKGILIYQDFPIQWRMSESSDLVGRAILQVSDMVNQLYNHPSIVIWCYGSEPGRHNFEKLGMALTNCSVREDPFRLVQPGNSPTFQLEEIDYYVEKYDWPIDCHFYHGWYGTEPVTGLEKLPIKALEFVTEYGSQSLPKLGLLKQFIPPTELWPPKWRHFRNHCLQVEIMQKWIGLAKDCKNLEEFIDKSQEYQSLQLKYHTEFYRRHKFRPANGALQFVFNDCWPAITWSVVDYERTPKKGYYALAKAFSPVHVMMEWLVGIKVREDFQRKIYLVNDLYRELSDLLLEWEMLDNEGKVLEKGEFETGISENTIVEVGILQAKRLPSSYKITLVVRDKKSTKLADNEYLFEYPFPLG